jgi:hypothetical protein
MTADFEPGRTKTEVSLDRQRVPRSNLLGSVPARVSVRGPTNDTKLSVIGGIFRVYIERELNCT